MHASFDVISTILFNFFVWAYYGISIFIGATTMSGCFYLIENYYDEKGETR